MSIIWDRLLDLSDQIETVLTNYSVQINEEGMEKFNQPGWVNKVFANENYRRAHIDIVDARENKGLWMMHCCIFPNVNNNSPIFGYDVIAGENKITGVFHDFSPVVKNHPMSSYFKSITDSFHWKKVRTLPDWALQIFSVDMIAAGNIKSEDIVDLENLSVVIDNLEFYIENIGKFNGNSDYSEEQNRYAFYQKQNPHTPKTMKALGLNDEDVDTFISKCLFPEINIVKQQV
jgi:hypothetical protein